MAENLYVGCYQIRLVVRYFTLSTEGLNQSLCASEIGSRHRWEQMVLDLIIQAGKNPIGEQASSHVPRCQDLAAQVVRAIALAEHSHARVVWHKRKTQI